jgi:hypothetical protein
VRNDIRRHIGFGAPGGSRTLDNSVFPDGNRVEAASDPLPAVTIEWVWDTNVGLPELVRERDGSGTTLRDYLFGSDFILDDPRRRPLLLPLRRNRKARVQLRKRSQTPFDSFR